MSITHENLTSVGRARKRAHREVAGAIDRKLQRAVLEIARELRAGAPKATSLLTHSIKPDREALMAWRVGPHVDYASMVERGTKGGGGAPPFLSILDWVRRRRLTPTSPSIAARKGRKQQTIALAWAIRRKIQQRGTPAQPFVGPVSRSGRVQRRVNRLVMQGITQGLKRARML